MMDSSGATLSVDPASAARPMANFGFLATCDLPDRPGPAYLLVALRASPTLHHYDPEAVEYWVSEAGRGKRRTLTRSTAMPIHEEFSWGVIQLVDRLQVTNEYLTFGGRLSAAIVDDVVIAVFVSPAPILRRGGHSQGWDTGAEHVGAFFSRFLLAVDYVPGFEGLAAASDPVARYAAFVADWMARCRTSPSLRDQQEDLWALLRAEERRLKASHPEAWKAGAKLRAELTRGGAPLSPPASAADGANRMQSGALVPVPGVARRNPPRGVES